jgi:hypothetical protein
MTKDMTRNGQLPFWILPVLAFSNVMYAKPQQIKSRRERPAFKQGEVGTL